MQQHISAGEVADAEYSQMNSPSIERIKSHIAQLANPHTNRGHRLMYLRLIIDCAHNAHSEELNRLEELKAVVVDEAFIPAGGIVE